MHPAWKEIEKEVCTLFHGKIHELCQAISQEHLSQIKEKERDIHQRYFGQVDASTLRGSIYAR
jgi:hypothetical protein